MAAPAGKDKGGKSKDELESEVLSAIAAFEQILEAIPNDRASLEALANTYEQIGDHTKAKEYAVRLANVLIEENDIEAAQAVAETLKQYVSADPSVQALIDRIGAMGAPSAGTREGAADGARAEAAASGQTVAQKAGDKGRAAFNMAEELAFAWNLLEAKEITQDEYSSLVQDLTEMSSVDSATTVSVLHVLEGRAFKSLDRVLVYVSKECGTPVISLACFEIKPEAFSLLPVDFMVKRGALVFELIGKDALVVVMNPYDRQLRRDIEALTGRKCHFFLTLPSEFDKALDAGLKGGNQSADKDKK